MGWSLSGSGKPGFNSTLSFDIKYYTHFIMTWPVLLTPIQRIAFFQAEANFTTLALHDQPAIILRLTLSENVLSGWLGVYDNPPQPGNFTAQPVLHLFGDVVDTRDCPVGINR
jgi:hypothetical protein